MSTTPISEPGSVKLDAIRELTRSYGWELMVGRIEEEIERRRNELEVPAEGNAVTNALRGRIAGMRTVLAIPAILAAEYAQEAKKE